MQLRQFQNLKRRAERERRKWNRGLPERKRGLRRSMFRKVLLVGGVFVRVRGMPMRF